MRQAAAMKRTDSLTLNVSNGTPSLWSCCGDVLSSCRQTAYWDHQKPPVNSSAVLRHPP